MSQTITRSFKENVTKHGYAFVPDYCAEADAVAIANELGTVMIPWEDGLVQKLVPHASAPPNTYSGMFGLGEFPFHTDLAHWRLPPHYLLLRCISGYPDIPTLLIDGQKIISAVTLDILTRAVFRPRRPRSGALILLRLCEPMDDGELLRWDEVFIKPASRIGDVADREVRAQIARCDPQSIALVRPGDTLLIDNWRMLHARSPILTGMENRKLERVYLEGLH